MFKNFTDCIRDIELEEVLNCIKSGENKTKIILLRKLIAESKNDEYDRQKKCLPAFTPCGTFKGGRKHDLITSYSRIIILDIDDVSEYKLQELVESCRRDLFVLAAFISPSGKGAKILVQVSSDADHHKSAFQQVKVYYQKLLKIKIDESGKDLTRLCFLSYDPGLYFNPDAKIFEINSDQKYKKDQKENVESIYNDCILKTETKFQFIDGNRNNFIHHLACNCNRSGVSLRDALSYILRDYNYNHEEAKKTITSAYNNYEEHDSLKNIRENKAKRASIILEIEDYLKNCYDFRYNIVSGFIEFKPLNEHNYIRMTDYEENSLFRKLLNNGINCAINKLQKILHSDFCPKYNPFVDYFNSLPAWDGKTDFIDMLSETVITTNQSLWKKSFKKWLVAVVACVLDDKTINQTVPVFTGPQGLGKTTWMERLIPGKLSAYKFSGTINPNNKDTLIHLVECMLINLDELENLNRSEIGSLKEIITKDQIRIRRPYGHNNETLPRRASFMGSVNASQFLNDATGSRRFLCFETQQIDYRHKIDIDQCYAQALFLFKQGTFKHWFDESEIDEINKNNEIYQISPVEEEML
ncbi:MAG TPA: VapE domain-containing protein, partial [Bacteroidia bacterium]|nr:VapE domain-containing protein [Bacteroidia bacterium]